MTAQLPSKVRLAQIASFTKSMALPPSHDEIEAMARFALAAHEQEPVAMRWRWKDDGWNGPGEWIYHDAKYFNDLSSSLTRVCELVYTHPAPAPAVSTREKLAALQLASIINDLGLPENAPFVEITSEIFRLKQLESPVPAVPDECPKCNGTGMMDSGGVQPWGEPIQVVCDCRYEVPTTTPAVPDDFICMLTGRAKYLREKGEIKSPELLERAAAVLQGGNVTSLAIPTGWKLVPIDPTKDMLRAGQSVVGFWLNTVHCYSKMLAAAPTAPGDQLTPAPEDRLQKAIFNACMVFLHGCDSLSKNYECDFSDSETELYFCIADVAKKIGVVEETGNRRWSLSQQMKEEINCVYRKYAMRIMEAAPKGV